MVIIEHHSSLTAGVTIERHVVMPHYHIMKLIVEIYTVVNAHCIYLLSIRTPFTVGGTFFSVF